MNRFVLALICLALAGASAQAFAQGSSADKKKAPSFSQGGAAPKKAPAQVPLKGAVVNKEKAQQKQMGLCSQKARDAKLTPGTPAHRQAVADCLKKG